jgi:hypothetical protein|tara:strand:+ start:482 stop:1210 length:729 start_codon:yes stop_codon:yes gene_type:complete
MARLLLLLGVSAVCSGVELPSCESDTDAHCVGEGADLSTEGIAACLQALGDGGRSERCSNYLRLMSACDADISGRGVCASAARDGEAVPCLVQRTPADQLTPDCAAALPKDELAGLAKYWADGKRQLNINEILEISADDKDTYDRWMKRKGRKKNDKDRERAYAVKTAKKERVTQVVTATVIEAMSAKGSTDPAEATAIAEAEAAKAVEEDLTGTLKPLTKGEIASVVKRALKEMKKAKKEL